MLINHELVAGAGDTWQMIAAVELGAVTVPSGVLVLGMAGWIDYWPQTGQDLSQRAAAAARHRGGHLRDGLCEAIAARASSGPLVVRAAAAPSPFGGEPAIAALEAGLGIAWPAGAARDPVLLGDLPVDRCGMVLGDAVALDAFAGIAGPATDGLADLAYWGRHADAAHAAFGGEVLACRCDRSSTRASYPACPGREGLSGLVLHATLVLVCQLLGGSGSGTLASTQSSSSGCQRSSANSAVSWCLASTWRMARSASRAASSGAAERKTFGSSADTATRCPSRLRTSSSSSGSRTDRTAFSTCAASLNVTVTRRSSAAGA